MPDQHANEPIVVEGEIRFRDGLNLTAPLLAFALWRGSRFLRGCGTRLIVTAVATGRTRRLLAFEGEAISLAAVPDSEIAAPAWWKNHYQTAEDE